MNRFILASASPRRKEILENIGLGFDILVSEADEESVDKNAEPGLLVRELAMLKASKTAQHVNGSAYIIAADTVVVFEGKILGKPKGEEEALEMLSQLSGKRHDVYTGVCVFKCPEGRAVCGYERTEVEFKNIERDTIERYVKTGEPADKAGAYGIQGKGAMLVRGIRGDYFNVVGLPVGLLNDLLKDEFDVTLL